MFESRAQQLIMLGCVQEHLIERMRGSIDLATDRSKGEQMLEAMEGCPPRGALFSRLTPDLGRPCGYARLCPWCHARAVQRLYRQLVDSPCSAERLKGKHLVVIQIRVDADEDLQASDVRDVRNEYRYRLRRIAREVGVEGGVILHQVTPWITWYDRPSEKQRIFAHLFTMIGTVDNRGVDTLDHRIEKACSGETCETARLPADTPHALRYLLFGSPYKFDTSGLRIVMSDWKQLQYGIQGAAALQPWFLFDGRQAWSYAAAMQGIRLYDTFGGWRESQTGREQCSRKRRSKSASGDENRTWAFMSSNDQRRDDANRRRRQLAKVVLPQFQANKDAGGKRLSGPAIRKILDDAGYAISDRDARWLAKNLPAMDTRSGFEKFVARRSLSLTSNPWVSFEVPQHQDSPVASDQA